jgi:hypothetical protein
MTRPPAEVDIRSAYFRGARIGHWTVAPKCIDRVTQVMVMSIPRVRAGADRTCHSGYIVHDRRFDAMWQPIWSYILEGSRSTGAMRFKEPI